MAVKRDQCFLLTNDIAYLVRKQEIVRTLYSPDLNRLGIDELEKVMKKLHNV